ncbi:MAG: alpha/beta fold hydrolase [Microgenomates group bacterium]
MNISCKVLNPSNEQLDVLIEGNDTSAITIIMAHGLGVDKHETGGMFDDIAKALGDSYRIVRFDFSGFGKSEGKTEEFDYHKHAADLDSIIRYVNKIYGGTLYLIAQSMGTFVTSLLNPKGIKKTIFTGIPNSDTKYITDRLIKRFTSKPGAYIDLNGISLVPRSSGAIQKFGPQFWKTLAEFSPVPAVAAFAKQTSLLIIHPKQDDVVGPEFQKEYEAIQDVTIEWMDGDHSFKKPQDRLVLIERIKTFFS